MFNFAEAQKEASARAFFDKTMEAVKRGDLLDAARYARQAYELAPDDPAVMRMLVHVLTSTEGNSPEIASLADKMARDHGDLAMTQEMLGSIALQNGAFKDAEEHFRSAISKNPNAVASIRGLFSISTPPKSDPVWAILRDLPKSPLLDDGSRAELFSILATAEHRAGRYKKAFEHAVEWGRLKVQSDGHDGADIRAVHEMRLKAMDDLGAYNELFERAKKVGSDVAPIFIVGMPRSGTTLVEQILAAHPDVHPAGELLLVNLYDEISKDLARKTRGWAGQEYTHWFELNEREFRQAADAFVDHVKTQAERPVTTFVDKMPGNIYLLGFILLMFPKAKIIRMRRHVLDVCVSCLFQNYPNQKLAYTRTMDGLARESHYCDAIGDRWAEILPVQMFSLWYEHLVTDFDGGVRALLEFCGLPFYKGCLRPHEVERKVTTASHRAVREPVNAKSIGRWKRHKNEIEPLVKALGGWEWIDKRKPPENVDWAAAVSTPADADT